MDRSRQTILEMLADRGYDIDVEDDEEISAHRGKTSLLVMWPEDANIGTIQTVAQKMETDHINRVILVVDCAVTASAKTAIKDLGRQKHIIEIFTTRELRFNWSRNELVPRHSLCSNEERDDMFQKYGIDPKKLPQMKKMDAMARYLGAIAGHVVKIVADSSVMPGNEVVTYRLVTG